MRFAQGASLGAYEIVSLLGAGGMGEVYRARDTRLGREVAINLGEKLRLYAEAGVAEYWIVDPALETSEFLVNAGNAFRVCLPEGATYRSAAIAGLAIEPDAFWRSIPTL